MELVFKYIIIFNILFLFFFLKNLIRKYNNEILKCKEYLNYKLNAINKKETLISENNYINHNILKNPKKDSLINEPFLPQNEEEINVKKYNKSYYNTSNIRYHFEDLFYYRKLFRINYSYLPYENVDKSKSYEYNANYIFETTGMLNITKLDQKYFNQKNADTLNFNHIHLSMGHDNNYILLSLVSIASILNTTNNNTFIHFHFVLLGSVYKDMKPIIALKKIYNNVEFIFYNGKQAEYDFYIYGKKEFRGIGDYAKFLNYF